MYVMIDNYDSFVYNLAVYFQELKQEISVIRNDQVSLAMLDKLHLDQQLEGIIISPGPKNPEDCGLSAQIVNAMAGAVPILGVCLGHQIIGHSFGACVEKGRLPMHGKVTNIFHWGRGLFENLPKSYEVTRYHSLVVCEKKLPDCLCVDAWAEDGTIMAISHKDYPVYGVQFHPEAVLTQFGHRLLENYIEICRRWKKSENIG